MTLIVSLLKNGKASGSLSEDAGDGFGYRKGEYLISGFTARQIGSNVNVKITAKEGSLKSTNRKYKIIIVTEKGPIESEWIAKNKITVKIPAK